MTPSPRSIRTSADTEWGTRSAGALSLARKAVITGLVGSIALLSACYAPQGEGDDPAPSISVGLKGGTDGRATQGVVELISRSSSLRCTGALLNKFMVVTTGRCLQNFLPAGQRKTQFPTEVFDMILNRWDPDLGAFKKICINAFQAAPPDAAGHCNEVKPKSLYLYGANPLPAGDVDNDLGIIQSDGYFWKGTQDSDYLDIYMGDIPELTNSGFSGFNLAGYGASNNANEINVAFLALSGFTQRSLTATAGAVKTCNGDAGAPWLVPLSASHSALVGLHSLNASSDSQGCATAGSLMRATRLRDKVGWIENVGQAPCLDTIQEGGHPVKRCWLFELAPACDGATTGTDGSEWAGCRGSGCAVCSELVANYPRYFQNHPDCLRNTTCGGSAYACSLNCPKPSAADQGMWGTGLAGYYYNKVTDGGVAAPNEILLAGIARYDSTINFDWGTGAPVPNLIGDSSMPGVPVTDQFGARWVGWVKVPSSGLYSFQTESDDGVRLRLDGSVIVDNWTLHSRTVNTSTSVWLNAGATKALQMDYFDGYGSAVAKLRWKTPASSSFVTVPSSALSP